MNTFTKENLASLALPATAVELLTTKGLPDDDSGEITFVSVSDDDPLETALDAMDCDEEDIEDLEDAMAVGHGLVIGCGSDGDNDDALLVLTEDGALHWVIDTHHPPSDLDDAELVNTSLAAFVQCLGARNALLKAVSALAPLPDDVDAWRAALKTAAEAIVGADPPAASRRAYWLPRIGRALGDFVEDTEHLELGSELINLVLDAGTRT